VSIPRSLAVPATVRRAAFSTPHGTLAAFDASPPGGATRPPVLLVPGFTGSKEDFLPLIEPLVEHGHRVVAFDQRGQYESTAPDDPALYTLERYAEDVVEVARTVDPDGVHLLGHSFGGLVAQRAVLDRPAVARSLTLLCTGPGALPADAGRDFDELRRGLEALGTGGVWPILRARQVAVRGAAAPDVEEFLRVRFTANSAASLIAMAATLATAEDRVDALAGSLAARGVPAHVITGEHDDSWTLDAQRLMADRLGAPWTVLAGAGHSPNVEAPAELVAAMTAFFSRV
jgi:pimeloyl-ACP methyl ester carboxylesterase